jgi:hypothetical protein
MASVVEKDISKNKLEPNIINISNLREERRKNNIKNAEDFLEKSKDTRNNKLINIKEYKRVLEDYKDDGITEDELLKKCKKDKMFRKAIAINISIEGSRQGSKDEITVIEKCNSITEQCGVYLKKLSAVAYRFKKNGSIINNKDFKKCKKNDCLKSFDGEISGKIDGWLFCKICLSEGGHQDNVFEEITTFCETVIISKEKNKYYVVILDTNLDKRFREIYEKYHEKKEGKLLIFNHRTFQEYIIQTFY